MDYMSLCKGTLLGGEHSVVAVHNVLHTIYIPLHLLLGGESDALHGPVH